MITYLSCMMMLALVVAGHNSNYFKRQKYGNSTRSNGFKKGFQLQRLEKLQKIYGGSFVDSITEYPYMAFIYVESDDYGSITCAGTILSRKYVLTAAHCLRACWHDQFSSGEVFCGDGQSEPFTIFLGNVVPKYATKVKVIRHFIHPEYTPFDEEDKCKNNYDIAIMELEKPIKFSKTMSKVNLPTSENNENNMKNCKIVGWGLTEEEEEVRNHVPYLDRRLMYTSSDVISMQKCIDHLMISEAGYSIYPNNVCRTNQMCTIDPKNKRGICQGDSGVPLICNGVQVGVASMMGTKGCVGPHMPSVFERVDINLKWIKHILQKFE